MDTTSKLGNLMDNAMEKIRNIVNVDTVVGSPITTPDGALIIPISRVSYAFATGGSDFRSSNGPEMGFGGGNGAGVRIEPVGFLTMKDGAVRMINVIPPANTTVDRVIDRVPEVIDLVDDLIEKHKKDKSQTS